MQKKEVLRSIKFMLFSASAGLIQIGASVVCEELLKLPTVAAYIIPLVLSVLWNFTFNRKFTFKSASNVPRAMLLVAAYYAVFVPLSVLNKSVCVNRAGWNFYLVTAINMVINFVTEFLYQRFVVYRSSVDSAVSEKETTAENEAEEQ